MKQVPMSHDPAMISIVMPVRDAAETVADAVESILGQTHRAWELVAVDDGSMDETRKILETFARSDPRIRVIATPPQGIARALQSGCTASRGEWIARMDADDWMHPERLAAQWEFARENPDLGVVSCLVGYGGDAPGYAAHVGWVNGLLTPEQISLRRFVEAPVAHPSVMFSRKLLEEHGGYREGDFPEDYELWLRWLDVGVRFGKLPRELMVWNDPPARLSRNDPRYAVDRFYQVKCRYLACWLRWNVDPARKLWLWGAGRITRRRFDSLEGLGFPFEGFIDVDRKKSGMHRDGRRVLMSDMLPDPNKAFVIVGVGNRGARELIAVDLTSKGWTEGRDFLLGA
jgi:glycosyltransferase involved in cell wall biosynthesis